MDEIQSRVLLGDKRQAANLIPQSKKCFRHFLDTYGDTLDKKTYFSRLGRITIQRLTEGYFKIYITGYGGGRPLAAGFSSGDAGEFHCVVLFNNGTIEVPFNKLEDPPLLLLDALTGPITPDYLWYIFDTFTTKGGNVYYSFYAVTDYVEFDRRNNVFTDYLGGALLTTTGRILTFRNDFQYPAYRISSFPQRMPDGRLAFIDCYSFSTTYSYQVWDDPLSTMVTRTYTGSVYTVYLLDPDTGDVEILCQNEKLPDSPFADGLIPETGSRVTGLPSARFANLNEFGGPSAYPVGGGTDKVYLIGTEIDQMLASYIYEPAYPGQAILKADASGISVAGVKKTFSIESLEGGDITYYLDSYFMSPSSALSILITLGHYYVPGINTSVSIASPPLGAVHAPFIELTYCPVADVLFGPSTLTKRLSYADATGVTATQYAGADFEAVHYPAGEIGNVEDIWVVLFYFEIGGSAMQSAVVKYDASLENPVVLLLTDPGEEWSSFAYSQDSKFVTVGRDSGNYMEVINVNTEKVFTVQGGADQIPNMVPLRSLPK